MDTSDTQPESDVFRWTPEHEETARRLYEVEGLTCLAVARMLGTTRGAVVGKVWRHGWVGGRRKPAPKLAPLPRPDVLPGPVETLGERQPAAPADVAAPPLPDEAPEPPAASPSAGIAILALRNETCRWPLGTETGRVELYCGGPADLAAGRVYCAAHRAIAYVKAPGKKEARS